ncbi:MAG TPA: hypothetical protein VF120_07110 [Ktedonobacterales bacterium]
MTTMVLADKRTGARDAHTTRLAGGDAPGSPDETDAVDEQSKSGRVGKKRGPKPGSEAAKHGGQAVRRKYGREFFARNGRKAGEVNKRERPPEYWASIGHRGGETTRERHGSEFYARIGRKGGLSRKKRTPPEEGIPSNGHE